MRRIILIAMLTITGCGEKPAVSKTEADARTAQSTNLNSQFGSGPRTPEEKFAEVKRKAESGNVKDQLGLARLYYNGDGITKDDAKAVEWWRKAAAQGNEAAQESLKNLPANGH